MRFVHLPKCKCGHEWQVHTPFKEPANDQEKKEMAFLMLDGFKFNMCKIASCSKCVKDA